LTIADIAGPFFSLDVSSPDGWLSKCFVFGYEFGYESNLEFYNYIINQLHIF